MWVKTRQEIPNEGTNKAQLKDGALLIATFLIQVYNLQLCINW